MDQFKTRCNWGVTWSEAAWLGSTRSCALLTAGDNSVREELVAKRDALVANYGKQRDALLADLLPEVGTTLPWDCNGRLSTDIVPSMASTKESWSFEL